MNEAVFNLLMTVLTAVITAVSAYGIAFIKKKGEQAAAQTDSIKRQDAIEEMTDAISVAVSATSQTYVDALKAAGSFDAEAQKQVRINEAEAEVARFNAMYEEYVKNPEITKKRMFYETMEDVLPGMKIVIDNGDGVQKVLPLDSFTGNSSENPTETLNTDPAQDTQDLNDSENE